MKIKMEFVYYKLTYSTVWPPKDKSFHIETLYESSTEARDAFRFLVEQKDELPLTYISVIGVNEDGTEDVCPVLDVIYYNGLTFSSVIGVNEDGTEDVRPVSNTIIYCNGRTYERDFQI